MHILFVGGTGNISTDCAALLHARGHEISVVTRGRSTVPTGYRVVQADRKDPSALRKALREVSPDIVVNFLGYELAEVQADYDLFRHNVRQYVFISSATVYEKPPRQLPIAETSPLGNPFWEYAQKKLACEQWLLERWREDHFPLTIVRPSHTYSRRWIPNPVSSSSYSFAARLEEGKPIYVPDDGENPWTLTTSADFAVGLAGLLDNTRALGESFHITSDEVLTWNQIVAEIAAALGVRSPKVVKVPTDLICQVAPQMTGTLRGDKAHPGVFDNAKIKRFVPDFKSHTPFAVGVRRSVEWLRAHPEQQNLSPQVDKTCEAVVEALLKYESGGRRWPAPLP
jgi:nucleoside-diphosphate-sugar epimerase